MMIDLHTHTTASDGSFTPVELVDYAVKKNLSAIAITDHDTMSGIQEAIDYIRESGLSLELIPGMEISTHYSGAPFGLHILAYFIVTDDEKLSDVLINFNRDIQQSSGTPSDAIDIVSNMVVFLFWHIRKNIIYLPQNCIPLSKNSFPMDLKGLSAFIQFIQRQRQYNIKRLRPNMDCS